MKIQLHVGTKADLSFNLRYFWLMKSKTAEIIEKNGLAFQDFWHRTSTLYSCTPCNDILAGEIMVSSRQHVDCRTIALIKSLYVCTGCLTEKYASLLHTTMQQRCILFSYTPCILQLLCYPMLSTFSSHNCISIIYEESNNENF